MSLYDKLHFNVQCIKTYSKCEFKRVDVFIWNNKDIKVLMNRVNAK